jgi:hypothetical protein
MSVHLSAWNSSVSTGRIFVKFDIWIFFENLSRIFKFHENLTRTTGTLHEDQCTISITCRFLLLAMRNVSGKICWENKNNFMLKPFFQKSCRLRDSAEKYCRAGQATNENMAHLHCVLDTQNHKHALKMCKNLLFFRCNNTYLHERASMLLLTFSCLMTCI